MLNRLRHLLVGVSGSLLLFGLGQGLAPSPSLASEEITLWYGGFARSVSVDDLQTYAETGNAPSELASILSLVKPEQRESLQKGLNRKIPLKVVQVDKLLRSPAGEKILSDVAEITKIPGGPQTQITALRGALIMAAASKDGLGVMSFLRNYPTPVMEIDVKAMQALLESGSLDIGSLLGGGLR